MLSNIYILDDLVFLNIISLLTNVATKFNQVIKRWHLIKKYTTEKEIYGCSFVLSSMYFLFNNNIYKLWDIHEFPAFTHCGI